MKTPRQRRIVIALNEDFASFAQYMADQRGYGTASAYLAAVLASVLPQRMKAERESDEEPHYEEDEGGGIRTIIDRDSESEDD